MHERLCRLPASEIEKALGDWIGELASLRPRRQIVLDGKTLRARAESEYPALRLLVAYCPQVGGVLAQLPVDGKDDEITAAKTMLKTLPAKGTVVTGDAMFCQRELCATLSSKGGDFLFVTKDNQPALVKDIEAAFSPGFPPKERLDRERSLSRHETVEKGHGRLEYRSLEATPMLCGYLDRWPSVKQVFRLVRRRGTSEETAYGITSLSPECASAARLLEISRRHWSIENSLHHVRDVTFLEDRCRTRFRNKAQTLASFRNLAITLIRQGKFECIPEGLEYYAENKDRAIDAVMKQRTE